MRYVQLPSGFKSHRFSSSSIAAQQESNRVHVVCNGLISWINMVKLLVYVYKYKIIHKNKKVNSKRIKDLPDERQVFICYWV